ncbi:MAG: hypothetical protein IJ092_10835 [Atopobiaceae bacterium]|nr:hypothetical protein [Atopobiaceae bacterium]
MRYTLMNQEHEVLSFSCAPGSTRPYDVRLLDGAAWAPIEVPTDGSDPTSALGFFLWERTIVSSRADAPDILRACGAANTLELALRSGGFSLSDQYWYRAEGSSLTWADANFFDNEWDPSFGEAVLAKDYDALAHASLRTPDVTLGGFCRPAWAQTERGLRLLKAPPEGDAACVSEGDAHIHCEALVSRMLDRRVGEDGHVPYEPLEVNGELYSSCPLMLGRNEELVSGTRVFTWVGLNSWTFDAQVTRDDFDSLMALYLGTLEKLGVEDGTQGMAKLFVMSSLALDGDTHPANFGLVRDVRTLKLRQAPLYDHGRGFLNLLGQHEALCRSPFLISVVLGRDFSRLDPAWDYSWYDPHALDGFEDEILSTLSVIPSLPEGYAELMARLFVVQRNYVNQVTQADRP